MKKTVIHSAVAALKNALADLKTLSEQSDAIAARIAGHQAQAAAAHAVLGQRDIAKAARAVILEAVAVGEKPGSVLDEADGELLSADSAAAAALRAIELAEAGVARLTRDHEVLALKIGDLHRDVVPALSYHAGVEMAVEKIIAYQQAATAFAAATAELGGALQAIDVFADTNAKPPRMFVESYAWPKHMDFSVPVLPGVVNDAVLAFNIGAGTAKVKAEILAALS